MQESKIVATKRLQDEGHWNEASLYREGIRETLRSEGMTRKEANRVAWEKMLEVFPPFDAEEEAAHWLCACYFPPAEADNVEAGQPSLEDLWYVLCTWKGYQAYQRQEEEQQPLEGLMLVEYAHHQSSSAQARAWLSILLENEQRFCSEVVEALSARIEQLVQEAKTEDQEAVVTELRAHEQGLLAVTAAPAR